MIDLLNKWMLESTGNFNIVVGLTALLFFGFSNCTYYYLQKNW